MATDNRYVANHGVPPRARFAHQRGASGPFIMDRFTLVELIVVLFILGAVTGIAIGLYGNMIKRSQIDATEANLEQLRDIIMGTPDLPGYYSDMRDIPDQIVDLFENPAQEGLENFDIITRQGWRGPYLQHSTGRYETRTAQNFFPKYGDDDDPATIDAWGNPVVLQIPEGSEAETNRANARLVSAGPNGVLDTPFDSANVIPSALNDDDRGDDIILFLRVADN